jgi:hypothetical protein
LGRREHDAVSEESLIRLQRSSILEKLPMVEGIKAFVDLMWEIFNVITNELEMLRMKGVGYTEICVPSGGVKTLSLNVRDSKKQQMVLDGMRAALNFIAREYSLPVAE